LPQPHLSFSGLFQVKSFQSSDLHLLPEPVPLDLYHLVSYLPILPFILRSTEAALLELCVENQPLFVKFTLRPPIQITADVL
jgi:hypothetical protein